MSIGIVTSLNDSLSLSQGDIFSPANWIRAILYFIGSSIERVFHQSNQCVRSFLIYLDVLC